VKRINAALAQYVATCDEPLLHPDALRCLYVRTLQDRHKNVSKVARLVGLPRRTVQRMLLKHPDQRTGQPCAKHCHECRSEA
jgi:ActR/RegA family two-component response regulator